MRILFPAVLFPGGDAAADVSLGLVHLQDFLHLLVQHPIELGQPFGDVLVHCGFADAEFLCGGADRGPVFDDVLSQPEGDYFFSFWIFSSRFRASLRVSSFLAKWRRIRWFTGSRKKLEPGTAPTPTSRARFLQNCRSLS